MNSATATSLAAFSTIGMILWLPRWFRTDGKLSSDQAADEIATLALAGVLAPSAKSRRVTKLRAVRKATKRR